MACRIQKKNINFSKVQFYNNRGSMVIDNMRINRDKIISAMNETLHSQENYQLQMIKVKEIQRINNIYGYSTGDIVIEKVHSVINKIVPEICPSAKVFHLKGCTFITISPTYSIAELHEHNIIFNNHIDKELEGILNIPDVIRCRIATIPLSKNIDLYCDKTFAKIEYYVHKQDIKSDDIYLYNESLFEKTVRQSNIKTRLEDALIKKRIKFHFQPQYDSNDRIVGLESLARWEDEQLGVIAPNEFIPEYENSPLYNEFCNYTIEQTLFEFSQLYNSGFDHISISINIMKRKFEDKSFSDFLTRIAKRNNIPFNKIILEITESTYSESDSKIADNIKTLRSLGFKLSVDDFGTGDASFARLIQLDFDELKFDRSFVNMMETTNINDKANRFLTSLCKFFRDSRIDVNIVFEGIEEEIQRNFVFEQLEVNVVQGFYYSKALPMAELRQDLLKSTAKIN